MIAVITGAGGSIGGEVRKSLEAAGHRVIALGRRDCDLSVLESVAALGDSLRSSHEQIDLVINNAAVAGRRGITAEGFELAFGVNYLSHYLLTRKLLNPGGRIVNVSSEAHRSVKSIDPHHGLGHTRSRMGWKEYAFSKACQIAFTTELAGRGVEAYSVHPGMVASGLWRPVPQPFRWAISRRMAPPELGALSVLRAALGHELTPGAYVTPTGVSDPTPVTHDRSACARLWLQSEEWVADYLD